MFDEIFRLILSTTEKFDENIWDLLGNSRVVGNNVSIIS